MADEENKKEDNKNNDENNMKEQSKLKTNYGWKCYKDTGNC